MDVLFLSDTHFDNHSEFSTPDASPNYPGCNSRMVRILEAFLRAVAYAQAHGIPVIFIPGDVFHRRGIINVAVFNAVSKAFRMAQEAGVKIYVMAGNHDVVDRQGRQSYDGLHALYAMGSAVVFNEPAVTRLGGIQTPYCVIPYTASREQWMKEAQRLMQAVATQSFERPPIIIAHQSFSGAKTGPHEFIMREGLNPETDVPKEAIAVVTGHYHEHQALVAPAPVIYVGGLVQHNFGERTYTPGWLVYHEDTETFEHIEDKYSPRFVVQQVDNVVQLTMLEEDTAILGTYYRVEWKGEPTMFDILARQVPDTISLRLAASSGAQLTRISFTGVEGVNEVLRKYIGYMKDSKGLPSGVTEENLLEVGREFLETVMRNGRV